MVVRRSILSALIFWSLLTGCQDDDDEQPAVPQTCSESGVLVAVEELVGLSEAGAVERAAEDDLTVRVVGRDGACEDRSSDLVPTRVDVYVEDGRVVRAERPAEPG